MRIVIIVHCLTGGGAERVAAMWANGFRERGHEVEVVIFDADSPRTYALREEIRVTVVTSRRRWVVVRIIERIVRLRKVLKGISPDVVIEAMPSWQRLVAMAGMGCKKIATEHDSFEKPTSAKEELGWFNKFWVNRLYSHVTVLTQVDKGVIGRRLKHVTVLPNPLALEPVKNVPPKEKIVLAVGRKDAWHYKGFDILIKAWSQVSADTEGWKLQIVGGSDKGGQEYLKDLCHKYGVSESVEFQDYQEDILPYYQKASIFVLSSRYEGFGLVLIEAMSQGCACIACDYKGRQSEIVTNGVSGVTCEPDHVEALVEALRKVIDDDELRNQLQSAAIRRAGDFRIDRIMDRWEVIFKKCRLS